MSNPSAAFSGHLLPQDWAALRALSATAVTALFDNRTLSAFLAGPVDNAFDAVVCGRILETVAPKTLEQAICDVSLAWPRAAIGGRKAWVNTRLHHWLFQFGGASHPSVSAAIRSGMVFLNNACNAGVLGRNVQGTDPEGWNWCSLPYQRWWFDSVNWGVRELHRQARSAPPTEFAGHFHQWLVKPFGTGRELAIYRTGWRADLQTDALMDDQTAAVSLPVALGAALDAVPVEAQDAAYSAVSAAVTSGALAGVNKRNFWAVLRHAKGFCDWAASQASLAGVPVSDQARAVFGAHAQMLAWLDPDLVTPHRLEALQQVLCAIESGSVADAISNNEGAEDLLAPLSLDALPIRRITGEDIKRLATLYLDTTPEILHVKFARTLARTIAQTELVNYLEFLTLDGNLHDKESPVSVGVNVLRKLVDQVPTWGGEERWLNPQIETLILENPKTPVGGTLLLAKLLDCLAPPLREPVFHMVRDAFRDRPGALAALITLYRCSDQLRSWVTEQSAVSGIQPDAVLMALVGDDARSYAWLVPVLSMPGAGAYLTEFVDLVRELGVQDARIDEQGYCGTSFGECLNVLPLERLRMDVAREEDINFIHYLYPEVPREVVEAQFAKPLRLTRIRDDAQTMSF